MSKPADKLCTLLFLRRGDELLLALKKRGFGEGHFNGVGGKIEPGETVEQALVRECQEEITVTPTAYEKVAQHHFLFADKDTADMIVHTYIADDWDGEPEETEEMAPQWFKITEIPYVHMWADDIYWLPAVLAGHKLMTHFCFGEDSQTVTAVAIKPLEPAHE